MAGSMTFPEVSNSHSVTCEAPHKTPEVQAYAEMSKR